MRHAGPPCEGVWCVVFLQVWNSVDTYSRKSFTSIIHGKYSHEETVATSSFAQDYLIVKDLKEAQYVCDYILHGGNKQEVRGCLVLSFGRGKVAHTADVPHDAAGLLAASFLQPTHLQFMDKFAKATSKGFDPEAMLSRVGLANQTTMLKGETEQIGKLLERTMMEKYGPGELNQHFIVMDTICDATQERQDALYEITADPSAIDMMVVVGGFNSSNTSHLQEIAEHKGIPSFWVDSAARIDVAGNTVLHKLAHGELVETKGWLPAGPLRVGITSGASTPDRAVEEVLEKVFRIKDPSFAGIQPRECAPMQVPTH